MAGHSHSANIAHRKGLVDAKRGKLFTKLCRAIHVAARTGGGDPAANMRLRYAIDPHEGVVGAVDQATQWFAPTFERFMRNVAASGLQSRPLIDPSRCLEQSHKLLLRRSDRRRR